MASRLTPFVVAFSLSTGVFLPMEATMNEPMTEAAESEVLVDLADELSDEALDRTEAPNALTGNCVYCTR